MHNEPLGGVYLARYYLIVVMASGAVALSILKKSLGIKLAVSKVLEPGAPKIIKETYKKKKQSQKLN